MQMYLLQPDENFKHPTSFDIEREGSLPGVICDICGRTWGAIGLIYPKFMLPSGLDPRDYKNRWPVPLPRFKQLRDSLQAGWGPTVPLGPGLEFGRSIGKARGKFGDFAWENSWCVFLSEHAQEKLAAEGFALTVGLPEIEWNRGKFKYGELHIDHFVELEGAVWSHCMREKCIGCGYVRIPEFEAGVSIGIRPESLRRGVHIHRIRECEAYILVTEGLAEVIRSLKLTDVSLTPFPPKVTE
jgi:hypothetical protein